MPEVPKRLLVSTKFKPVVEDSAAGLNEQNLGLDYEALKAKRTKTRATPPAMHKAMRSNVLSIGNMVFSLRVLTTYFSRSRL